MSEKSGAIIDTFVALVDALPATMSEERALQAFREQLIDRWDAIELAARRDAGSLLQRLSPAQHRALRALEVAPDLMGPLGLARDEVRHVRGLAWLMNQPDPTGAACLGAFLSLIGVNEADTTWTVDTEVFLGDEGRVDLVLACPDQCVLVEAKVDAAVRRGQLEDYRVALDRRRVERATLVLLAPNPPEAGPGSSHQCVSWEDVFVAFLPYANLETPTGLWLAAWLRSVATHLLNLDRRGPLASWPLGHQLQLLRLLSSHFEDHRA